MWSKCCAKVVQASPHLYKQKIQNRLDRWIFTLTSPELGAVLAPTENFYTDCVISRLSGKSHALILQPI